MAHWYTQDGKAQHFQPNGKDTTLRDARKDNLLPSVTGILDILAKPGLERAAKGKILDEVIINPRVVGGPGVMGEPDYLPELSEDFKKRILNDAFTDWTAARDRGSEIHNCMEDMFKAHVDLTPSNEFIDLPIGEHASDIVVISGLAVRSIVEFCDMESFISEQIVVGDGYGGAVDLHNDDFVIDMKSKDITDKQWDAYQNGKDPRIAYPENCMQLSAYDRALGHDPRRLDRGKVLQRRLINVYIDRQEPGRIIFHEWQENYYDRFMLLVKYWQMDKNYYP